MKRQSDVKRREAALTDVAAGELNGFASWRLRREIERDTDLRLEWEKTQEVWTQLRGLRSEAAPEKPNWPSASGISTTKRTVTIGGFTMNRRVAFAAIAAFSLCTVTAGAYVGQKWLIDPYLDAKDGHGHVWRVVGHFKGEVKKYDIDNHYLGSFGADGGGGVSEPTAEVTLDGHTYTLSGAGRHAIKNADGILLGYADLVPETDDERADERKAYIKRQRVDELLPISFGSSDQADGSEIGFFGDKREIQWTLSGDVDATFTRTDSGHVVYHGMATTKFLISSSGQVVSNTSAKGKTTVPILKWTVADKIQTLRGYGSSAEITLPTGIRVKVELVKRAN